MNNLATLLLDDLKYGAEWRQLKASRWPDGADRNLEAAARLERIASDLERLEGLQWHWWLEACCAKNHERYCETLSGLIRAVGFGSSARTGGEFLMELRLLLWTDQKTDGDVPLFAVDES